MTTELRRAVARELGTFVRSAGRVRPLVATITAQGLELRQKGTRTRYVLPWGVAWVQAAKLHAAEQAAARKAARAERRRARG